MRPRCACLAVLTLLAAALPGQAQVIVRDRGDIKERDELYRNLPGEYPHLRNTPKKDLRYPRQLEDQMNWAQPPAATVQPPRPSRVPRPQNPEVWEPAGRVRVVPTPVAPPVSPYP